jgi:hypothetical protein
MNSPPPPPSVQLVLGLLIANKQALLLAQSASARYPNYTGANDPMLWGYAIFVIF